MSWPCRRDACVFIYFVIASLELCKLIFNFNKCSGIFSVANIITNKILTVMMKILIQSAPAQIDVDIYKFPALNVVEVTSEGVLCSSFEKYDEFELEW